MKKIPLRPILIGLLLFSWHAKLDAQVVNSTTVQWNRHVADSLLVTLKTAIEDSNKVDLLHNLSFRLWRIKEYDQAIQYENASLDLARKLNLSGREARANSYLGSIYGEMGKYSEALQYQFAALKIAEANGRIGGIGTANNEIASIYYNQGKYEESLQYLLAARKSWKQINNLDGLAFNSQNVADIYQKQGKYQDALDNYFDALEHWKKGKEEFDSIWVCANYGSIGNIYLDMGNYNEALKYFSDELTIAYKITKAVAQLTAHRNLGTLNSLQGNFAEALKNYFMALRIAEDMKYKNYIADIHNDIGNVYSSKEDYAEALDHYSTSLKIREEIEDKGSMIRIYSNMGNIYSKERKFSDALIYQFHAKTIADETGDRPGIFLADHNIAVTYLKKSELLQRSNGSEDSISYSLSESFKHESSALKVAEELGGKSDLAESNIGMGEILIKQATYVNKHDARSKYNEGITYLKKGLLLAKGLGAKEQMRDAYSALSEAYTKVEDYQKALEFTALHAQMKDSLVNDETIKKIEQYRIKYEVDKKESEERIKQEKAADQLKFEFARREDSSRFQKQLSDEQLRQLTLLDKQKEQELELKQASLNLANQQNELNRVSNLKTMAELQAEQSQRLEKEKQLTIADQERALQRNRLKLQQAQLTLKESELQATRKERFYFIGGIVLLLLLFFFIFRNFKNRQRANSIIATEKLKLEKANAAHKMIELELQSLRTQLNPHFMFNSLNAIQELILMEDNENSHIYLSRFSELLRMLLDNANQPFIPLRKEIEFLKLYLTLENLRIPDLQYSIELNPNIQAEKIMIPNMMLQPYIENAIWHGLSHKKDNRRLQIRIQQKGNVILFEIEDNGVGRKKATEMKSLYRKEHKSKGMELLSKRFSLLSKEYGADIKTHVTDLVERNDAAGTLVEVAVPISFSELSKRN